MSGPSDYKPSHPALQWFERRLPIIGLMHSSFVAYPTPKNLNYWWTFGAILSFMLGLQILGLGHLEGNGQGALLPFAGKLGRGPVVQ